MTPIYIPSGPKNLQSLFPAIDFSQVDTYTLSLESTAGATLVTTNQFKIDRCTDDTIRIHFLNQLGTIDAMNFRLPTADLEVTSDSYEKPVGIPFDRTAHGVNRMTVKANKLYTAKSVEYSEDELAWVEELLISPMAWIEWAGTQGQPDSYLPIVIVDQKTNVLKEEDRYTYEVSVQFKFSHAKFIIRN